MGEITPYAIILKEELEKIGISVELEHFDGHKTVDLWIEKAQLVIEVDGSQHQEAEQALVDITRARHSLKNGITTIRFPNTAVHKYPADCAKEIKEYIDLIQKEKKEHNSERNFVNINEIYYDLNNYIATPHGRVKYDKCRHFILRIGNTLADTRLIWVPELDKWVDTKYEQYTKRNLSKYDLYEDKDFSKWFKEKGLLLKPDYEIRPTNHYKWIAPAEEEGDFEEIEEEDLEDMGKKEDRGEEKVILPPTTITKRSRTVKEKTVKKNKLPKKKSFFKRLFG